jgi:hypothetical protein
MKKKVLEFAATNGAPYKRVLLNVGLRIILYSLDRSYTIYVLTFDYITWF